MDKCLTETTANYSMPFTRFILGRFTPYSGIHKNKVQAINRWQPKVVFLSLFIAASHFLKNTYISATGAVNYLQLNTVRQYNKLINADCQKASFVLIVRCAAGYQERYIVKD